MKNILPFLLLLSCSTQESIEEVTNLDKVDSIVWWEIQNDSVIIWTEEDEKRADIDRLNYIRSLDTTDNTKEK
jgi:hypothetical protein